jgi:hypothetical protein
MRLFFLTIGVLADNLVIAQELSEFNLVPPMAIKVSPLHLLNFYPTIEWSYEQRIRPRITTQAEVGYVVDYGYDQDEDFRDKRGVKLKLEGRYYFGAPASEKRIYYSAMEPYLNIINFDRREVVKECFDKECLHEYTRQYIDKIKYREYGVSFKIGLLRYVDSRTFIDLNTGVTVRNIRYEKPAGRFKGVQWGIAIPNENNRIALSPCFGFRLGYRLK